MDKLTPRVAETVTNLCDEVGESQNSLAETTGIPRSTLLRRLSGASSFKIDELEAVAGRLGLKVSDIVSAAEGLEESA